MSQGALARLLEVDKGYIRSFEIPLGEKKYALSVSSWKMIRNNGRNLESVGIEPDMPVETTPEDVINRRDVELEVAKQYLGSND